MNNLRISAFFTPQLILFFAILLMFTSCRTSEDPIRIGATMSLSGSLSTQGIAAANGYRLCETDLNHEEGLFGRPIEISIYDDESNPERAIDLYKQLITEEGVDAILGPYGSTLTEAVAPVTEEHRYIHISPLAATTSIWEQGREYLFMVLPPAELFLSGLMEMASQKGLDRVAILAQDAIFPQAAAAGAKERAEVLGLEVLVFENYPTGTEDFDRYLHMLKNEQIEVFAMAASPLDDFIKMTRQMKSANLNVKMFGTSGAVAQYQEALGVDAEYTFGLSAWEPTLPWPGIDEFVESYRDQFGMEPSFHAAGAYSSCRLFAKAAREAGNLNPDLMREILLEMETTTLFGPYAVDNRGYQTANQGVFIQWQDGEKVVVWPEEVATGSPIIPAPPWNER